MQFVVSKYDHVKGDGEVENAHPALIALSLLPFTTSGAHLTGAAQRIFVPVTEATRVPSTALPATTPYTATSATMWGIHRASIT